MKFLIQIAPIVVEADDLEEAIIEACNNIECQDYKLVINNELIGAYKTPSSTK